MLTRDTILKTLEGVKDPSTGISVVDARMISGVTVRPGGKVGFLITTGIDERFEKDWLRKACEQAVLSLPGVASVTAVLTAETIGSDASPAQAVSNIPRARAQWNSEPLAHVRRIIAVASGKGGVGKSTTTVNLAHALTHLGHNVGILDADITGPSIPRMMGLTHAPEMRDNRILPLVSYGIACMSMGLMVGEDSALVWRGPQLSKALNQLLRGVEWGTAEKPLDILLIDMPPGTGDIHLSLAQQAPVAGAIIVTTPQGIAVVDARKCIDMFRKVHIRVLGVIENMSGFTDLATGVTHAIFGSEGGLSLSKSADVPYFGKVPIEMAIRAASDNGEKWEDTGVYRSIALKCIPIETEG